MARDALYAVGVGLLAVSFPTAYLLWRAWRRHRDKPEPPRHAKPPG